MTQKYSLNHILRKSTPKNVKCAIDLYFIKSCCSLKMTISRVKKGKEAIKKMSKNVFRET